MKSVYLLSGRERGFSLIELLVALAVGLIVVLAVGTFFSATRRSYVQTDASSRLQENGRSGMHILATDIRMAGFMGCRQNLESINNIAQPSSNLFFKYTQAVRGYEYGGTLPPGLPSWSEVKAGTSLLSIQRGESVSARLAGNLDPSNAQIQIKGNPAAIQDDEILMVTDCTYADIFRVNNVSHNGQVVGSNVTVTINHSAAKNTQSHLSHSYLADSELMRLINRLYYVGSGQGSCPAETLCRLNLAVASGSPTIQVESLIANVEDMDLRYGVDADGDKGADRYAASASVTDWSNVMAVQVNMLLRSDHSQVTTSAADYWYNGVKTTPATTDRHLRRSVSQVVSIRNRTL